RGSRASASLWARSSAGIASSRRFATSWARPRPDAARWSEWSAIRGWGSPVSSRSCADLFWAMALLGEQRRAPTARCRTAMSALELDERDFRILLDAVPQLQERFADTVDRRAACRDELISHR